MRLDVVSTSTNQRFGLIQAAKLPNLKQNSFSEHAFLLSSGLFYQLHKEDELDKTMYQDDFYDLEEEDEFYPEEENTRDNYEEDYEFDYHRHK